MLESGLTERILRVIHQRGGWAFKTHGSGFTRRGIPDIVGAYKGRAIALEVKQPGRQPTRIQQHELARAAAAGAAAFVVTSVEQALAILTSIEESPR
jgi:Holliday junction resolvase